MKLVFVGEQACGKSASNLFTIIILMVCLASLAYAEQVPVMQDVISDFIRVDEQAKMEEPIIIAQDKPIEEAKPKVQDMKEVEKLEPYVITLLDDITKGEFDAVLDYLREVRNRTASELTFESYVKFFVSSLSNDDVEELSKRKEELKIDSIDLDDMAYTQKSEL